MWSAGVHTHASSHAGVTIATLACWRSPSATLKALTHAVTSGGAPSTTSGPSAASVASERSTACCRVALSTFNRAHSWCTAWARSAEPLGPAPCRGGARRRQRGAAPHRGTDGRAAVSRGRCARPLRRPGGDLARRGAGGRRDALRAHVRAGQNGRPDPPVRGDNRAASGRRATSLKGEGEGLSPRRRIRVRCRCWAGSGASRGCGSTPGARPPSRRWA